MCCRILDKHDWSFEVAEDGYVHAIKAYYSGLEGFLYSPFQIHYPNDFLVISDRTDFKLNAHDRYGVKQGIHAYLYIARGGLGHNIPVRIKPEDIVMVGGFGNSASIVATKVELEKEYDGYNKRRYRIEKYRNRLRSVEIK